MTSGNPPTLFFKWGRGPGSSSGHAFEDELGFLVDVVVVVGGTTSKQAGNNGRQEGPTFFEYAARAS